MKYVEHESEGTMKSKNAAGAPNRPTSNDPVRGGGPQNPRSAEKKKLQKKDKKSPGREKPSNPGDRGQKELA